jgi:hypothetical protein
MDAQYTDLKNLNAVKFMLFISMSMPLFVSMLTLFSRLNYANFIKQLLTLTFCFGNTYLLER